MNLIWGRQPKPNMGKLDFTATVSKLAQDELGKRQHYRPVYSLHKYWARRAGSQFRSILLRTLLPDSILFLQDEDGSLSAKSKYFKNFDFKNKVILDPFMGGGTTLIESNRLGCNVIGWDLNPLSWWITREGLKIIDVDRLKKYADEVFKVAQNELDDFYKTEIENSNGDLVKADVMHFFWFREAKCEICEKEVSLHSRTILNKGLKRNIGISSENPATTVCLACGDLGEWNGSGDFDCKSCNSKSDPLSKGVSSGSFECCGKKQKVVENVKKYGRLKERLVAIEYIDPDTKQRLYKSPSKEDLRIIEQGRLLVEANKNKLAIPNSKIPKGDSSKRWLNHQYERYVDVFSDRQILAVNSILESIKSVIPIDDIEYRYSLITALSNSLEYNNMMVPYNYPHRKLHHLFTHHALPITMMPVENNLLGIEGKGAGTFRNCVTRYLKGKKYCNSPYDKYKNAQNKLISVDSDERIGATFVDDIDQFGESNASLLRCGDSTKLHEHIPDKSVDYVITDPPYYDSIHYSELANFFYVWMKEFCPEVEFFSRETIDSTKEAIVNKGHNKGAKEYTDLMAGVFSSCHRVLKDDGKLVFTFHHKKIEAWWTIAESLSRAGFCVVNTFAVESEYKVNPHIRDKETLDMDLVLVCEKKNPGNTDPTDIFSELIAKASEKHNNPNWHYLQFIGLLLTETTRCFDNNSVNFEWFEEMNKKHNSLNHRS